MKTPRWTIAIDDVPSDSTIARYIFEKTDIKTFIAQLPKPNLPDCLKIPVSFDLKALQDDLRKQLQIYPAYSYPYGVAPVTPLYRMIYLTYNSHSQNPQISNPFPTAKDSFPAEAIEGISFGKNSHDDTLAIVDRTNITKTGELKSLLDQFHRTLVRSKITVHSALTAQNHAQSILSWHTDESLFINTRLNIPIFSSENFAIEYQFDGPDGPDIGSFDLMPGFAYAFDTQKPHRFYAKRSMDFTRVSLICGFSPWFDYDHEARTYYSNAYYGELHPLEILRSGGVADFLSYIDPKISEPGKAEAHSYHSVT